MNTSISYKDILIQGDRNRQQAQMFVERAKELKKLRVAKRAQDLKRRKRVYDKYFDNFVIIFITEIIGLPIELSKLIYSFIEFQYLMCLDDLDREILSDLNCSAPVETIIPVFHSIKLKGPCDKCVNYPPHDIELYSMRNYSHRYLLDYCQYYEHTLVRSCIKSGTNILRNQYI